MPLSAPFLHFPPFLTRPRVFTSQIRYWFIESVLRCLYPTCNRVRSRQVIGVLRLVSCWLRGTLKNYKILETTHRTRTTLRRKNLWQVSVECLMMGFKCFNRNRSQVFTSKYVVLVRCRRLQDLLGYWAFERSIIYLQYIGRYHKVQSIGICTYSYLCSTKMIQSRTD